MPLYANPVMPEHHIANILQDTYSQQLLKTITFGPATTSGTSTATGATSLTDGGASWTVDAYIGLTVYSNGSSGVVTTNSATVLTVASWTGGTPTAVKPYMVGAAGINGPVGAVTLATCTGVVLVHAVVEPLNDLPLLFVCFPCIYSILFHHHVLPPIFNRFRLEVKHLRHHLNEGGIG